MKFVVFMKVHASATVEVETDSAEEAMEIADSEYTEAPISICHQCNNHISDPTFGDPVEAIEA